LVEPFWFFGFVYSPKFEKNGGKNSSKKKKKMEDEKNGGIKI